MSMFFDMSGNCLHINPMGNHYYNGFLSLQQLFETGEYEDDEEMERQLAEVRCCVVCVYQYR